MDPVKEPNVIGAEIDKAAFLAECGKLLDASPILDSVKLVAADLHWPPPINALLRDLPKLVAAVAAAVEVVKQKYIAAAPPGSKFDKELAAKTAGDLLDSLIVFKGFFGRMLEACDGALWQLAVSVFVMGQKRDWLATAQEILGIGK